MSTIINFRQIMKMTLALISLLMPVFFTGRSIVSDMVDGSLIEISLVFCIPDSLLSLTKFPPIINLYI